MVTKAYLDKLLETIDFNQGNFQYIHPNSFKPIMEKFWQAFYRNNIACLFFLTR